MAKVIELNNEKMSRVKGKMLKTVLSKALSNSITPNFNGAVYVELLGGSFESVQDKVNSIPFPSEAQAVIKALVQTIDTKLDNYAAKKNYKLYALEADEDSTEDETDEAVFEDVEFETEKGDDENVDTASFDASTSASDSIGDAIKSMFEDLANKQANEIKNLAKTVLKLEKVKQDEDLKEKKEESGEFVEEDETDDKKDKEENKDGDEGGFGSEEGGESEGDNPFADDSSEGEGDTSEDSGENPFDKSDDSDSSDNPFDGDGEGGNEESGDGEETSGGDSENPFEDGSSEGEDKAEGGFESCREYSEIESRILGTPNKINLFKNLRKGDVINFSKYVSRKILDSELNTAYSSESQDNLEKSMDKYKKLTKSLISSVSDTLAMGHAIGLEMDINYIKYPHLYEK